jgi:hypothetical protein
MLMQKRVLKRKREAEDDEDLKRKRDAKDEDG